MSDPVDFEKKTHSEQTNLILDYTLKIYNSYKQLKKEKIDIPEISEGSVPYLTTSIVESYMYNYIGNGGDRVEQTN